MCMSPEVFPVYLAPSAPLFSCIVVPKQATLGGSSIYEVFSVCNREGGSVTSIHFGVLRICVQGGDPTTQKICRCHKCTVPFHTSASPVASQDLFYGRHKGCSCCHRGCCPQRGKKCPPLSRFIDTSLSPTYRIAKS